MPNKSLEAKRYRPKLSTFLTMVQVCVSTSILLTISVQGVIIKSVVGIVSHHKLALITTNHSHLR